MSPFGTTVGRTDGRTDRRSDVVIYRATISAKHLDPVFLEPLEPLAQDSPKMLASLVFMVQGLPWYLC